MFLHAQDQMRDIDLKCEMYAEWNMLEHYRSSHVQFSVSVSGK